MVSERNRRTQEQNGGRGMTLSYIIETLGQVCLGICFLYMAVLVYFFVVDGVFRGKLNE